MRILCFFNRISADVTFAVEELIAFYTDLIVYGCFFGDSTWESQPRPRRLGLSGLAIENNYLQKLGLLIPSNLTQTKY
jgi:hypothetical protein